MLQGGAVAFSHTARETLNAGVRRFGAAKPQKQRPPTFEHVKRVVGALNPAQPKNILCGLYLTSACRPS